MKNVTLVVCMILLYGFISQNLTNGNVTRKGIDCVRSTGITWRALKRIRDLELTPNGREELMKDKNNLQDYGCFLGCMWQRNPAEWPQGPLIDDEMVTADIQQLYSNDSDVKLAINKAMVTCAEIAGKEKDGCELVLDFKFCIFENMRDYS